MKKMARQFVRHLRQQEIPKDVFEKVEALILEKGEDMEGLIDAAHAIKAGEEKKKALGIESNDPLSQHFDLIQQEAEWIVQHLCERARADYAARMWAPLARAAEKHQIAFATTNYDRAIEIACSELDVPFHDGFEPFQSNELASFAPIPATSAAPKGKLEILKIHGSTDWYESEAGDIYKLRHPMPLFGGLKISTNNAELALKSALILPSQEKRTSDPPYPALMTKFRVRAEAADVAVFIGTSLRDKEIKQICKECSARTATYVVSLDEELLAEAKSTGAITVRQTASQFAVSSLPKILRASDVKALPSETELEVTRIAEVLPAISAAFDASLSEYERCQAIELLFSNHIELGQTDIALLLEDENENIQIYALAFLIDSPNQSQLIKQAKKKAKESPGSNFEAELKVLHELIKK